MPAETQPTGAPQENQAQTATLSQTIDRIAGIINGTAEQDHPKMLWEEGKSRAKTFQEAYEANQGHKMDYQKLVRLSNWIKADESSATPQSTELTSALIQLWNKVASPGHPGHDKRHLMQDLKAGLTMTKDLIEKGSTEMTWYQKFMLLGSMMHDFGRLAEVRATGGIVGGESGTEHPKASFLITEEILKHFPGIDQELKDQLLYSILMHQTRLKPNDPAQSFIVGQPGPYIVQIGDRLQMFGPEAHARHLQWDAGLDTRDILATPDESRKTKLEPGKKDPKLPVSIHAENILRTHGPVELPLLPISESWSKDVKDRAKEENEAIANANERMRLQGKRREVITGTYLMLGWPHLREEIFAPELEVERREREASGSGEKWRDDNKQAYADNDKNFLKPDVWEAIKQETVDVLTQGSELNRKVMGKQANRSLEDLALAMVSADNMAKQDDEIATIKKKVAAVTDPQQRQALGLAFAYNLVKMEEFDGEHRRVTDVIRDQKNAELYPPHGLERLLAEFASLPAKKQLKLRGRSG